MARMLPFKEGDVLIAEGEQDTAAYLIRKGWLLVHRARPGRAVSQIRLGPGDIVGELGLAGRIGLTEESLSFYSGLLARQIPSAVAIQATVEHFADAKVSIDQFIERPIPLNREDQTQIGIANGRLGEDTVCGSFVWECQTKFIVNLGPMPFGDFSRFLPTGDMLQPIFSLVRYMVGIEYEFEIRIFLKRREVPTCVLGDPAQSARLGWSAWVKSSRV